MKTNHADEPEHCNILNPKGKGPGEIDRQTSKSIHSPSTVTEPACDGPWKPNWQLTKDDSVLNQGQEGAPRNPRLYQTCNHRYQTHLHVRSSYPWFPTEKHHPMDSRRIENSPYQSHSLSRSLLQHYCLNPLTLGSTLNNNHYYVFLLSLS
jgi:hypothetical protein